MTAKLAFEASAIELGKVQAPALKLYEFNYLFNKAINQFVNKVYNLYDMNQQTADDLHVLKDSVFLEPKKRGSTSSGGSKYIKSSQDATYEVDLPIDYLHLLNCVCIFYVTRLKDCWDAGTYTEIPATRLTADSWPLVLSDIYNRPSPTKPYYYIHNQTLAAQVVYKNEGALDGVAVTQYNGDYYTYITNSWYRINNVKIENGIATRTSDTITSTQKVVSSTDINALNTLSSKNTVMLYPGFNEFINYTINDSSVTISFKTNSAKQNNFLRTIPIDLDGDGSADSNVSLIEKPSGLRAGNTSNVKLEIRYGKDDKIFQLKEVLVDYIKAPQYIRLTLEQLDSVEDTSQILEFPEYVNQEIINELVHLIMEHINDPRLANNILMTQSIARPTGQLAQPAR